MVLVMPVSAPVRNLSSGPRWPATPVTTSVFGVNHYACACVEEASVVCFLNHAVGHTGGARYERTRDSVSCAA